MARRDRRQGRRSRARRAGAGCTAGRVAADRICRWIALSVGSRERRTCAAAGHSAIRPGRAAGRSPGRDLRRGRHRPRRGRRHAPASPHEGGGRAPDRDRRHRRRLAGDAHDTGDHRAGGDRRRCGGALFARRGDAPRPAQAAGSRPARSRLRLHRARHGQDGRGRAELFQRHRPDRVLRARRRRAGRHRGGGLVLCPDHARSGEASAGAHRRRLCVPRRSAAAPRSGLDRGRGVGGIRRSNTTAASARTGSARR